MSKPTAPLDLLALDDTLTAAQLQLRGEVRAFLDSNVRPFISDWYEQGVLPTRELAQQLGSLGLLGMHLEGYGCRGLDATSYGLVCMELEAVDSGLRSLVSVQGSLAMYAIHAFGSEEQKQQWLPAMARGEKLGGFSLSEPEFGSNPSGMTARARLDGDAWVLNGAKKWITSGTAADVVVIWAQTGDTSRDIRAFLVPTDTPGLVITPIDRKLSLRASASSELTLTDVRIPQTALLPGTKGLGSALACLNEARFGIVFGVVGAARDCLESATTYAMQRVQFERPIAGFQLTQKKLADAAAKLNGAYLLALRLGQLKDAHQIRPEQVSLGKFTNVQAALEIARESRSILGGVGITLDFPVMRHMNNLESVLTYEGTHEIHTLVLGEALTGIPAYRG